MNDKIISRIKKLLARAKSSNQHEAALAASMAQELMLKHQISEASLKEDNDEVEEIIEFSIGKETRAYAWRLSLAHGVTAAFGCEYYYQEQEIHIGPRKSRIFVVGTESNRNAVQYMFSYLVNEINRLATIAWKQEVQEYVDSGLNKDYLPSAHGWKLSFRLGAAVCISNRLIEQRKVIFQEAQKDQNNSKALVRIKDIESRIKIYKENIDLGKTSATGGNAEFRDGYKIGKEAGKNINIESGKGLQAPKAQLKDRN